MKKIVLIILFFNSISSASFYYDLDLFFYSKYVSDGIVKYDEIMNEKTLLEKITTGLSGSLPGDNEAPDI